MKHFAHIVDLSGTADGVQGVVSDFVVLAETDAEMALMLDVGIPAARTEAGLAELVGDRWPYFVYAPDSQVAGWRYENGEFIEPGAPAEVEAAPEA